MSVPPGLVEYAVVLLLGVSLGLLLRFAVALVVVLAAVVGIVALLGYLDVRLFGQVLAWLARRTVLLDTLEGFLFTVVGLVFVVGVVAGLLLTTPLRGLAPSRAA